jgi:hypothetical protein
MSDQPPASVCTRGETVMLMLVGVALTLFGAYGGMLPVSTLGGILVGATLRTLSVEGEKSDV